jgi:gliding motility-associated-like protein
MKKIYLLIAIFISVFSFTTSASNIGIKNDRVVLKGESSHSITNPKTLVFSKFKKSLAAPTSNPTASSTTLCQGGTLTLTANPSEGVAPYTFSWTGPNGYVSTDQNPVINNIGVSAAGVYSLVVTDALNDTSIIQSTAAIIVNSKIDPEFDATLPAICKGGFAPILSTTSTNGITGTWSPTLVNNTTTTTYIFTPDPGQCANSLTFTIFVLNNVDPRFTLPASICSGDTPPILPIVSNNGIVGTWNPSTVNNTASGSYVFTPAAGQCATVTTVNIAINPLVPVFIPAIQSICSGESVSPLPLISTNGITGTWSPAFNNITTNTYTFTPNAGQCAPTTATATMTVTINPIAAVFTQVAPICSGQTLTPLPTTSDNGVIGTWSPAMNNTATTTYTFTPSVGQCTATPVTMTIVVNPIAAIFTQVAPICSGQTLASLPTTSNNGVTGNWSPAINNTATTTYTFTPTNGQCTVTPVTMTIVVNPIAAVFTQVAPICSGQTLTPLPTTSDNGVTGTWSPAMNNTATTTYTFTPSVGQCTATPVTMTIVVNPIAAIFTQVAPICSGQTLASLPTTSNNGVTGNWSPAINNTATTTYTFTPSVGQCTATPVTMTIVVNPIAAVFTQVAPICSSQTLAPLPTTSNNGVTGNWSPAMNNTATTTYTFTPTLGQCTVTPVTMTIVVNPIAAVFTQVAPICSGQTLASLPTTSNNGVIGTWSPVINNTATTTYTFNPTVGQCTVTPVTMTIVVNPIAAVFTQVAPICSGQTLTPLPTTSNNGVTGNWSPAMNNLATTTYTFTPTLGQCTVTPVTMTIVVNPIAAVFTQVAPICSGQTLDPLPTTSNNGVTGNWSPVINNTATTTYTFTPTVGQCTVTPVTMTIVVNPIAAVFTQVTPICSGQTLAPLPTTSNNGVTGTWSPAINNTATMTYTFTQTAGQCTVTPVTMTIVVNPILAVFSQVAPICSGQTLAPLPTTSNNGVTGTWSPTINNTATTTYTFTPTIGQCTVTPVTMTIVVNPITAVFTQVAPICSGQTLAPLPTTSNNGVTGTWSPTINNTATTTYTFTPAVGQCTITPVTMTIVVNPILAVFTQVAPICSGETLAPLSTTSNNGVTGNWSPAMNNTATTTYTFTPTVGQCTVTPVTMTIVVNPIAAVFTQVAPICSGQSLAPLPTTSNNGVTGNWSPAMNNLATTTYTFTPTLGQCTVTPVTMTIVVNPIAAIFTQVAPICSGQTLAALPTTSNNGVTGNWSPAINNTATTTYTFTPTVGQCTVTPFTMTIVVNPLAAVFTQVAPICSGQTLAPLPTTSNNGVTGNWSPAMNNLATTTYTFTPTLGQCTVTPVTMTIVVNPIAAVFTQVAPICSGQTLAPLPTTSNNGVTGNWSPAMNNTATTTYTFTPTIGQCTVTPVTMTIVVNPIVTPAFTAIAPFCSGVVSPILATTSNNSIVGTWNPATISNTNSATYTFTPTAGQCATTTTLDVTIIPNVIPLFDPIADVCYNSNPPSLPLTSTNGITGTWSPSTVSNTVSGIYTFTPAVGICATTTTLTINVNTITPLFNTVSPICANGTAPILPLTSTNGIIGTWNPAIVSNTASGNYVFTPNSGQCARTTTLSVTVNQNTTPTFTAIAPICSGATSPVLPLTSNNSITGTWNPSTVSNTLSRTYTFTPTAGQCATSTTLNVTVNPIIIPHFAPISPLCSGEVSPVLPLTSTNGVTGTWNPAIVSNTLSSNYIFTPTAGQCAPTTTLNVIVNPSPTSIALKSTDVINQRPDGIIEITGVTSGLAPFKYSINNSSFTSNTIYSNLNPGDYTITVLDSNGCVFSKMVTVNSICLIPNVISPNNDTYNDTFDLTGCEVVKLQIYNRYGVEVNDFRNYSDQWGGNNRKGESLPDGTYFYVAEIKNGTSKSGWVFVTR